MIQTNIVRLLGTIIWTIVSTPISPILRCMWIYICILAEKFVRCESRHLFAQPWAAWVDSSSAWSQSSLPERAGPDLGHPAVVRCTLLYVVGRWYLLMLLLYVIVCYCWMLLLLLCWYCSYWPQNITLAVIFEVKRWLSPAIEVIKLIVVNQQLDLVLNRQCKHTSRNQEQSQMGSRHAIVPASPWM